MVGKHRMALDLIRVIYREKESDEVLDTLMFPWLWQRMALA
jgi:hypothetical protein